MLKGLGTALTYAPSQNSCLPVIDQKRGRGSEVRGVQKDPDPKRKKKEGFVSRPLAARHKLSKLNPPHLCVGFSLTPDP